MFPVTTKTCIIVSEFDLPHALFRGRRVGAFVRLRTISRRQAQYLADQKQIARH